MKIKLLIAGIAGASLGTEIAKCLKLSDNYELYGCDISNLAYGHYSHYFKKTFRINHNDYINSILTLCQKHKINYIIPGGESPNRLLSSYDYFLNEHKIKLVTNNAHVVALCSSKKKLF